MPLTTRKSGLRTCRVYPVLLFICYLEVVLWTSCLLLSTVPKVTQAESLDSHNYLLREKGNLAHGLTGCHIGGSYKQDHPADHLPPALLSERESLLDLRALRRQLQDALCLVNVELLQPALTTLRIFEEASGVPAPYTGIKALS